MNATVSLILDSDHEYLMREWVDQAQERLLVASHKLGPPALRRLRRGGKGVGTESFQYKVLYGETDLRGDTFNEVTAVLGPAGGRLVRVPGLHAKVLLSDSSLCVSSFNFLYGAPFVAGGSARELGVVLKGREPADGLWSQFGNWLA